MSVQIGGINYMHHACIHPHVRGRIHALDA